MKHNYKLNNQHDISAAITRIYKQINSIENQYIPKTQPITNTDPIKPVKPTLKLVK